MENLIITHVGYVKFTLKAQDFLNFTKAQNFFKEFLYHIFILSDLCILFYGNIIYENFSKTYIFSFMFFI